MMLGLHQVTMMLLCCNKPLFVTLFATSTLEGDYILVWRL